MSSSNSSSDMSYGKIQESQRHGGGLWWWNIFFRYTGLWKRPPWISDIFKHKLEERKWTRKYLETSSPGRWCNKFKGPVVGTHVACLKAARNWMTKVKIEAKSSEWGREWEEMRK